MSKQLQRQTFGANEKKKKELAKKWTVDSGEWTLPPDVGKKQKRKLKWKNNNKSEQNCWTLNWVEHLLLFNVPNVMLLLPWLFHAAHVWLSFFILVKCLNVFLQIKSRNWKSTNSKKQNQNSLSAVFPFFLLFWNLTEAKQSKYTTRTHTQSVRQTICLKAWHEF